MSEEKLKCVECGIELVGHKKRFCSKKCEREYNAKKSGRESYFIQKTCPYCNKEFKTPNLNKIFCSDYCCARFMSIENPSITALRRFKLFERDKFRCSYCGRSSIEDGIKLHLDHIYPLSLGGLNTVDNLITSCETCNTSKNNLVLSEEELKRVLEEVAKRNKIYGLNPKTEIKDIDLPE